ncbi:Protein FAM32A [Lamellibrachia satsuma]|nr:Protein FAM32A [Lamellibrachia satsuma]
MGGSHQGYELREEVQGDCAMKKRRKHKDAKKILEQLSKHDDGEQSEAPQRIDKRTKAEIKFAETKAKRDAEEILKKASKTHKERIMEFNEHLDNLSEHFDIPKVSWTK